MNMHGERRKHRFSRYSRIFFLGWSQKVSDFRQDVRKHRPEHRQDDDGPVNNKIDPRDIDFFALRKSGPRNIAGETNLCSRD